MTRGWWAVPILACLALAGCGQDKAVRDDGAITFRVNPDLLGERFDRSGSGLSLRAPAGWSALPDSAISAAMDRLRASGSTIGVSEPVLLALYRDDRDGASLAVSSYAIELPPASRDSLALLHLRTMKQRHASGQVADGRFVYRGYEIVQIRAVDAQSVAFKLLLSRPSHALVQLDYVVPRNVYSRELEAVESSIGSLEPKS